MREMVEPFDRGAKTRLNLRVNPQRRSLKGILLVFINPYAAGARDTENYFNPDITKVKVTVNGVPNRVYNEVSTAATCGKNSPVTSGHKGTRTSEGNHPLAAGHT